MLMEIVNHLLMNENPTTNTQNTFITFEDEFERVCEYEHFRPHNNLSRIDVDRKRT